MSVDAVQPALHLQTVQPKPERKRNSGRDPGRDGKSRDEPQESRETPHAVLNALGQLTGHTINITA